MRAWQIHRNGEPEAALELADVPIPEPGPGRLRIRVGAAALGLPDVLMCRGTYAFDPPKPFTPGQEVSGIVTAAGPGARTPIGARVMAVTAFFEGHGGFAEEALALDDSAFEAPDTMSDAEAAAFSIPFHTAWVALVRRGQLEDGESLVVLGAAGGTGTAAILLGRALGARVIAVAGGAEKVTACRALGADVVIDHREVDFADAVREATGGRGADVVFDPVGGETFQHARRCIASEGRLLVVGFAGGDAGAAGLGDVVMKNYSVVGVFVGAYGRDVMSHGHEELIDLHREGRIRSVVGRQAAFEALPAALAELSARRSLGRTVIEIGRADAR